MASELSATAFYASSGVLFGIAIVSAAVRTGIRLRYFRKLDVDDGFLFLAVLTLIGGTAALYVNVPMTVMQQQVQAGLREPPPDFMDIMINDDRTVKAGNALIGTTIYSVKYAFMFFFLRIMRGTTRPYTRIWWWFSLIVVTGCAPVMIFGDFILCPYVGEKIFTKCYGPGALSRQHAVVLATVIVDVVSDILVISIPVLIIWNLKLSARKKFSLAAVLCLSVFMIICAVIRVSTADGPNGQVNALWVILWLELEGCIAVITVSVSAFRILFTDANAAARPPKVAVQGCADSSSGGYETKAPAVRLSNFPELSNAGSSSYFSDWTLSSSDENGNVEEIEAANRYRHVDTTLSSSSAHQVQDRDQVQQATSLSREQNYRSHHARPV